MKSARTLIGLPVILECKPLGYICQATPDERLDHLERIYFSSGTGARMIERDQVDAIGEVAMLVHAPGKRAQLPESFWPRRAISTDGARLGAITDALIDEGFERYILPEDREVLRSLREEVKPLVNLVTLSVDSPTHYVGAAHRHDPVQEHVIGPDESSYGFDPCEMEAGCWSLCLSVHAVVTPECRFELSVEEVEA